DRRLQHRNRVAQRQRDRRVRKRLYERGQLLEMLRRLQYPSTRTAQETQHLQLPAQERVVHALVEREIGVAPPRHARVPFEGVRAEIEVDELAVLLDAPRWAVVHVLRERRGVLTGLPVGVAPRVPRIESVAARTVAGHGNRLGALPPRQRSKAR